MSQIFFTHASKPTTTTSTTSTSSTSSLLKRNISTTTTKTTTNAAASVSLTPPTSTTSVKSLFNNRNLKTFIALTGLSCTGTLLYIQSQRHHQSLPTTITTTTTTIATIATTTTTTAATNAATLKRKVTSAQHLLGGTVGGILGIVASYPFDTVKVKIQTQSHLYPSKMIDCFKFIVKNEGVAALYRGMLSPVVGVAGVKAVVFGSYGGFQSWLLNRKQNNHHHHHHSTTTPVTLSTFETILASCGAGFVATAVVTPVERVKVAMQSGQTAYKSTIDCVVSLVKTGGIANGLYKGFTATVLREVPSYGFYFLSYEVAKKAFLKPNQDPSSLSPVLLALSGGIAGIMAWLPIYPIDVIKSRIQAQSGSGNSGNSGNSGKMYNGVIDCAVQSYKKEGMAVFFRGLTPTIARAFPCHAAVFFGYEMTLRLTSSFFQ